MRVIGFLVLVMTMGCHPAGGGDGDGAGGHGGAGGGSDQTRYYGVVPIPLCEEREGLAPCCEIPEDVFGERVACPSGTTFERIPYNPDPAADRQVGWTCVDREGRPAGPLMRGTVLGEGQNAWLDYGHYGDIRTTVEICNSGRYEATVRVTEAGDGTTEECATDCWGECKAPWVPCEE